MAMPGETVVLEFDAPKKEIMNSFVATQEHAMMMRGYLFVK